MTKTKTKTSNGWSWVLRDHESTTWQRSKFRQDFDGAYLAACPACGQDCPWNAYNGMPLCECVPGE